jgi:hypothetical protein
VSLIVFSLLFVVLGAGETDPNPSRHVAAVVVVLAELGVVVDFNLPVLADLSAPRDSRSHFPVNPR